MAPESADHTYIWGSLVTRLSQILGNRALVRPPAPITKILGLKPRPSRTAF
jgi:hypothetical protein